MELDIDIDVNETEKQIPDVPRLADIFYKPFKALLSNTPQRYFHSFKAICNRMIGTAHSFQLSVRALLTVQEVKTVLDKIRKMVKSFRKSSVALLHLKNSFKWSTDFHRPLRHLIDVSTVVSL